MGAIVNAGQLPAGHCCGEPRQHMCSLPRPVEQQRCGGPVLTTTTSLDKETTTRPAAKRQPHYKTRINIYAPYPKQTPAGVDQSDNQFGLIRTFSFSFSCKINLEGLIIFRIRRTGQDSLLNF